MDYVILAAALVLLLALLMGSEYINSQKYRKKMLEQMFESYGDTGKRGYKAEELEHIRMYYKKHPQENQIDDITWNDLDMDRIYQKINTCCSAAGDEYLYFRLRTPMYTEQELEDTERQIAYFIEHEKERHAVQVELYALGRSGKHSIYEYLETLDTLGERKSGKYFLMDALLLACVGVMFVSLPIGIVSFVLVSCYNVLHYFKEFKPIEPYVTSFAYIRRVLKCAGEIIKTPLEAYESEQESLRECYHKLKGFLRNSYLVITAQQESGNPILDAILDYFKMFLYLDLIQFNRTLADLRNHLAEVDEMVTMLGRMETAIAVGSYRKSLEGRFCVPKVGFAESNDGRENVKAGGRGLILEDVYHPLLQNPVANSIVTKRSILLTGSNASGKSTFLRAVAVNALFAQTIHTCLATRYEGPVFRIYSSMALRDDLISGDSYYMVEIKSIKRILDNVNRAEEENCCALCFVDEVLRGTNTVERIAASTQILKMLADSKAICFAATHDVELTKLLAGTYENYHFEERIENDDIHFPYQLLQGPATTRNAIALLNMLGYDERIVGEAEKMAGTFLQTGKWEG